MINAQLNQVRPGISTARACASWTLSRSALFLGLCLLVLFGSFQYSYSADPPSAKEKELNIIQARAKALGNNTQSPEWAQLLKDFRAWAKKYGVQLQDNNPQVPLAPAPAVGAGHLGPPCKFSPCPPIDVTPCCWCVLDASRSGCGKCVYKCTPKN